MNLEAIPDELFLHIFRYLHKFDLLFSFTNLNQRFEQLVEPYLYEVNLTDHYTPSYRQFRPFYRHILPLYAQKIQSLRLSGYEQLQLFQPYISQLTTLKSLLIETKRWDNKTDYQRAFYHFLVQMLSSIRSLRELSVVPPGNFDMELVSAVANNLTTLTFICHYLSPMNVSNLTPMSSLKSLTFDACSTECLFELLDATPNLEELNLVLTIVISIKHSLNKFKAPKSLRQLLLKVDGYRNVRFGNPLSLKTIKTFLSVFQNEVRHLTLIALNVSEQLSYFDQLQSLVQNFVHLEQFDYFIRTAHQPRTSDLGLFPHIKQFPDSSYSLSNIICSQQLPTFEEIEQTVDSVLTMEELYNSTQLYASFCSSASNILDLQGAKFQLDNLRSIVFRNPVNKSHDTFNQFMRNVIILSPNLSSLTLPTHVDTTHVIKQLCDLVSSERRKQITDLRLAAMSTKWLYFHSTFWSELSDVLPNLRKLRLENDFKFIYQYAPTLLEFLQMIRKIFRKITHLEIEQIFYTTDPMEMDNGNTSRPLENLRKELYENNQQHVEELFPYHCTIKAYDPPAAQFDFWL